MSDTPSPTPKQPFSKLFLVFVAYTAIFVCLWRIFDFGDLILRFQSMEISHWYAALFSVAYVIRGFFYIPSLYFIVIASLLFPFPVSLIAYMSGVLASASLSYTIGYLLRTKELFPRFQKFVSREDIRERIERQGLYGVFLLHVIGFLDIPNYLSGYLKVPLRSFLVVVLLANTLTAGAFFILFAFGLIDVIELVS